MSSSLVGRNLGQYKILSVLGSGGMASVYLGYQATIDRQVAIKILPPHPGLDADFRERFQLEARTIGNLQNPGILPLYDYGTEDDVLYLVMAYVQGGTLADEISNGAMDVHEVERILRIIASALDYAHRQGVIHRDIKPANILMQEGHPLLADFGMVKMLSTESQLTGTAIVGTPAYMPPEQGRGDEIDARADIYSLGVVVYEMLTGQQPYRSDSPMQMIFQHMNDPIPSIHDVRDDLPAELQSVMNRVLAKMPDDRYATAADFAQDFSRVIRSDSSFMRIQKGLPVGVRTEKMPAPDQNPSEIPETVDQSNPANQTIIVRERNSPILMIFAAFGLVTLGIVIAVLIFLSNLPRPEDAGDVIEFIEEVATVRSEIEGDNDDEPAVVVPDVPTFGDVRFRTVSADDNILGNRISIRLDGVTSLPDESVYAGWLFNTETEDYLFVGEFVVDSLDGQGDLIPTELDEMAILPASYNAVLITEETAASIGETPSDTVAYSASLPVEAMIAIREMFVLATGDSVIRIDNNERREVSLWDAAVREAGFAERHAGLAAAASNIAGGRTHAEHTINILLGTLDDFTDDTAQNPGFRIGLVPQLDTMDTLLEAAITHPDATVTLQTNAEFVRVCIQNVRDWTDEIIELENNFFTAESLDELENEITASTTLTAQLTTGVDANEADGIEPFEGECGLNQIPEYILQLSSMELVEGGLSESAQE